MAHLKHHPTPSTELVSQLREANQNLVISSLRAQELQDQAETAVVRQTEFLSMLAHELRNPLAPIAMAADLLKNASESHPELTHIHQVIARQVGSMKRLLEDLLDASRVSSGKVTLRKSALMLSDIVQAAVEISQPLLDKNHQPLTVDLPVLPVVIEGDAVRLSQVFSNLLINASKYSSPGDAIGLSARLQPDGALAIRVKDRGVGIEPEMQPFIFDLFTQVPRTLDRSEGGLGIGLSMVRTLVELHGGTVQVCSEGLGQGSEFTVLLPSMPASRPPEASLAQPAQPAQPARSCRVLVIEDNVDANETLRLCLEFDGHAVDSAFDGSAGLAMAAGGHHDVVVCDIGLPGIDGYEVLRQLRLSPPSPMPCCIAMTGYDQQDFRAHALKVGFDHYLVKPVSIEVLHDIISTAFPLTAATG